MKKDTTVVLGAHGHVSNAANKRGPLSTGAEWTFELLAKYDRAIGAIATDEFGLDCYPNQIEVISSEQMLDAYSMTGLPIGYPHWSFGKSFIHHDHEYRTGMRGLAYEIVINSDPCIAYLMEENTMPMQALVIAHASYGHNSFFKGNYLFRQWTSADAIIDYMVFARQYVRDCEEQHGVAAVEEAARCLPRADGFRHQPLPPSEAAVAGGRTAPASRAPGILLAAVRRDLAHPARQPGCRDTSARRPARFPEEPQENLLYFVEKHSPSCSPGSASWSGSCARWRSTSTLRA